MGDLDVGGFNITVDDWLRLVVHVDESIANLDDPGDHHIFRHARALKQLILKVFALDEIHHQVLPLTRNDEMVGNPWQVRMTQVSEQLGFALKLALGFSGGLQVLLEGTLTLESEVPGAIDGTKTALSEQLDRTITIVEHSTRVQRHNILHVTVFLYSDRLSITSLWTHGFITKGFDIPKLIGGSIHHKIAYLWLSGNNLIAEK